MEFPRQEYWSGLPFPSPGDLPDPGIEPTSWVSPALAGGFFTTEPFLFNSKQMSPFSVFHSQGNWLPLPSPNGILAPCPQDPAVSWVSLSFFFCSSFHPCACPSLGGLDGFFLKALVLVFSATADCITFLCTSSPSVDPIGHIQTCECEDASQVSISGWDSRAQLSDKLHTHNQMSACSTPCQLQDVSNSACPALNLASVFTDLFLCQCSLTLSRGLHVNTAEDDLSVLPSVYP